MNIARRITIIVLSVVAALLFLVVVASLLITNTDWGREQVRSLAVNQLEAAIEGEITLGKLEGDLLRQLRLIDVSIVDTDGRPFIRADTFETGYSLLGLLRKRIVLSDVRLVNGEVILDQRPGEDWNFVQIFMADPDTTASESAWGQWIEFRDIELVDSRVMMRSEWEPDPELTGPAREEAIRAALAGESRTNVVEVPGGLQNVMDFRELYATLPLVQVSHPDTAAIPVEVASFSGIVQPFAPPAAIIEDLSGNLLIAEDSLFFSDMSAVLPSSRLRADGVFAMEHGELTMTLEGAPAALEDLRWLYPPLPEEGGGTLNLALQMGGATTHIRAEDVDLAVGASRIAGRIDLMMGETLRLEDTDIRIDSLDTRLIQHLAPQIDFPRHGLLDGHLVVDGTTDLMTVDGEIIFNDFSGGSSHVVADGQVGMGDDVQLTNLLVRVDPLQVDLIHAFAPDLPISGVIIGEARLDGTVGGLMQLSSDLTLRDARTGRSRVTAAGGIDMRDELRLHNLDVRFDPLRLDLVRQQVPDIPQAAVLTGVIRLDGAPQSHLDVAGNLSVTDPQSGVSSVSVDGALAYGDGLRFSNFHAQMQPLRLDLLRRYVDDVPPGASVAGSVMLNGALASLMHVDAALTLNDPSSGTSRVAVDGGVAMEPGFRFDDMAVNLDPLRLELVRPFAPDLQVGGVLAGQAFLDGAPENGIAFTVDLTHEDEGEFSSVAGRGEVATAAQGYVDVDLRLEPMSLNTVNRLAPSTGLQGSARGFVQAEGSLMDLHFRTDLIFHDSSRVDAVGRLDRTGAQMAYNVDAVFDAFDLDAITTRAPATTSLTGTLHADGRGSDIETMVVRVIADLQGSSVDGQRADLIRLDAALADGMATVDSARIRLASAELEAQGSFGLVEGREGELRFSISSDSLEAFSGLVAGVDISAVAPRPAARERFTEYAQREAAQARQDASVEYLATGRLPSIDTPETRGLQPIQRDTLAGSIEASGTVHGNVSRFNATADVQARDLVVQGNYVENGEITLALDDILTEDMEGTVDARFERVLAAGYAFERVNLTASYAGARYGRGNFQLEIEQDDATDIQADAAFALTLERNELQLRDMAVRLDTVVWSADGESIIDWSGAGARVHDLRLASSEGGHIHIDGDLPIDGPADVRIELDQVDIAHIYRLLQGESGTTGMLSMDARLEGPLEAPRIEGEAQLVDAALEGRDIPDAQLDFQYADQTLEVSAIASQNGTEMAVAEGTIPINLALAGVTERLVDRPVDITVRADQLQLDVLPVFTDQVEAVEGTATIDLSIGGRVDAPVLDGSLALVMESLRIVPLGITLERITGNAATENGVLRLDSLVAWSDGPIRIWGDVDLETLTDPNLDLRVEARDAWVMNTRDVELQLDADLEITGAMDGIAITGDVRTRHGIIYIPELAEFGGGDVVNLDDPAIAQRADTLLEAQRQVVTERSELMENLELDLTVQIDRDVWLRSSEANVEIYTPEETGPLQVRMTGLQDMPTIEGTINTDRGRFEYASRRFLLTRGAVTFMGEDELNPILQVAAEYEVQVPGSEAFIIRIIIGGSLQQPEIALESTAQPPISQSDLLSFLVFGRDASSLLQSGGSSISGQGTAGGGLVGNVAGLATQQYAAVALEALVSRVESDLARDLGVDVLRITPADLPPELFTGSYLDVLRGTEIEVGSYVAPRLFISAQARPTFVYPGLRIQYRTRRGLEWSTSWQPQYLPEFPTLREREANRTNVFGSFLSREWRF